MASQQTTDRTLLADQASLDIRVAIGRFRRRVREAASDRDLTSTQVSVLVRLGKGEATTASGLADLEKVRPQTMATTIAGLEDRGLVSRRPDPDDGRRQIVTLTESGQSMSSGLRDQYRDWLTHIIAEHLDEEEQRTLIAAAALLERLARA